MALRLEYKAAVGHAVLSYLTRLGRTATAVSQTIGTADFTTIARQLVQLFQRTVTPRHVCAGIAAYAVWRTVYALCFSPLRTVPGRFLYRLNPVFSLFDSVTGSTNDDMVEDCRQYGHVYVMEPRKVAVCHPDDGRLVLSSYSFVKDKLYDNPDFLDPSIFTTRDAELNKRRRRQVGPALSMSGLLKMEPTVLAAGVQQLMRKWDEYIDRSQGKAKVCYFYDIKLMTFDVIASLSLGHKHRSLTDGSRRTGAWVEKTFALMLTQMMLPIVKRWPLRALTYFLWGRDINEFLEFGHRTIMHRKADISRDPSSKPNDILQQFIDAEDPESNGIKMTPSEVLTETITLIIGGVDTTSTAISWSIHLLLLYPEHLKLLVDQIRYAFAKDQLITYEMARDRVPYLEACVLESLRLCPTSTNLPRTVPRGGITLRGHHIPEGYTAVVSIAACAMNPSVWASPRLYDPTRFLGCEAEANRRNVLTFSAGVRICPGRHLAMIEIVTTLVNILNRYDVSLPPDAQYTPFNVDSEGLPIIMPRTNMVSMVPRYPARDCNIVISRR
ncbi:hypothetical protein IW140_002183 [Coemansia sp. RSA 1813]|nr:hypothetical protein EV178_001333 [Coemansia sp. RSA 1646]KAJ1770219.1 hypothetical protein LPJ74_003364 [Coemansia sp. RSA 1843]KAJ2090176.1 hypothetical protein IW138_002808 [Coemansia sp. RSA 986]KAJ2214583.1 hypothetical protein EV179_002842 [Coemansia sp. RSA 487]KAJ2570757.1 hypothetical protein IW140_002183 [Coemansia sp. RSA 1813]